MNQNSLQHFIHEEAIDLFSNRLFISECRQTSNISHTLVGNKIVDHSDAVGAWPIGAAPTASSLLT